MNSINQELEMDKLVKKVAIEAVREYKKEEESKKKKTIYQNTEILLRHYNNLKEHSLKAIDSIDYIENDKALEIDFDNIYIYAIRKSKIRTAIMIQHIDMALEILKKNLSEKGEVQKYNVLIDIFLNHCTYEFVAEKNYCSTMTISRWKNEMVKELGILLFGSDGLIK